MKKLLIVCFAMFTLSQAFSKATFILPHALYGFRAYIVTEIKENGVWRDACCDDFQSELIIDCVDDCE